ncbi:MAG TPA: class I SAM-dependent rRNA methyltransferase [Thermoanaerobaculia bacterium]|nr:class I SAM-dependent rRNA methyltransferase [Thermoanaerobaculia bacterium]
MKSGRERLAANRHPWIFGGAIGKESGPDDAPLADLLDPGGKRIASGFHSRHSQIRLRVIAWENEELTPELLVSRIRAAIARRVFDDATTNAGRLIHAEGDDLSGLVVDRYGDLLVVEIANRGLEQLRELVTDALREQLAPRVVYFKNDLPARKLEQLPAESEWAGAGEPTATIVENGLRFLVEPHEGQKTGFFLDQRENRLLARGLAAGRRVLNLFSYSGAFGVYAGAGGASFVENADVSAKAIELARTNHELNGIDAVFTVADVFQLVRARAAAREQYGLVICDPPAFAKSRAEVDRAARGYKDVNLYSLRLTEPGGLLMTFSCSGHMSLDLFQKVVFSAAHDVGRRVSIIRRLTAAPDHPVSLYCPEGEYLKGFLLQVH